MHQKQLVKFEKLQKTFIFFDIADNNKVLYALLAELESIYLREAGYTLKGPTSS